MRLAPSTFRAVLLLAAGLNCAWGAVAATSAPPFLDINAQCEAAHRKNVDAISECVVAESEARSEILQKWDKVPDADAATCLKSSRKSKRLPYVALAKCLSTEVGAKETAAKAPSSVKR